MRIEVINTNTNSISPVLAEGSHLYSGSGNSWTVVPRPPLAVETTAGGALTFRAYPNPYVVLKANWDKPSDYVLVTQKAISTMPLRVWEEKGDPVHANTQNQGTIGIKEYVDFSAWDGNSPTEPTNRTISSNTILYFPDATNYVSPAAGFSDAILVANIANTDSDPKKIYLTWSTTAAALQSYTSATSGANFALLGSDGATKGPQTFLSPINIEQKLTVNSYTIDSISYPATIYSDNTEASIFDENITTLSIGGSASTITLGDASTSGSTITTIYGSTIINGSLQATEIDGGSF